MRAHTYLDTAISIEFRHIPRNPCVIMMMYDYYPAPKGEGGGLNPNTTSVARIRDF